MITQQIVEITLAKSPSGWVLGLWVCRRWAAVFPGKYKTKREAQAMMRRVKSHFSEESIPRPDGEEQTDAYAVCVLLKSVLSDGLHDQP